MRTWDERDSLLRKTTRKIKEMEIPENAATDMRKLLSSAENTKTRRRISREERPRR